MMAYRLLSSWKCGNLGRALGCPRGPMRTPEPVEEGQSTAAAKRCTLAFLNPGALEWISLLYFVRLQYDEAYIRNVRVENPCGRERAKKNSAPKNLRGIWTPSGESKQMVEFCEIVMQLRDSFCFGRVKLRSLLGIIIRRKTKTPEKTCDSEGLVLATICPKNIPKESIVAEVESSIRALPSVIADQVRFEAVKCLISAKPPRWNPRNLRSDPESIILPADKGNATVILDSPKDQVQTPANATSKLAVADQRIIEIVRHGERRPCDANGSSSLLEEEATSLLPPSDGCLLKVFGNSRANFVNSNALVFVTLMRKERTYMKMNHLFDVVARGPYVLGRGERDEVGNRIRIG
ncbi:hypothetical protein Trydic_g15829 [Trypoxylus dichotomus]